MFPADVFVVVYSGLARSVAAIFRDSADERIVGGNFGVVVIEWVIVLLRVESELAEVDDLVDMEMPDKDSESECVGDGVREIG